MNTRYTLILSVAVLSAFGAGCSPATPEAIVPTPLPAPTTAATTPAPTSAPTTKPAPKPAAKAPTLQLQPNAPKKPSAHQTVVVTIKDNAFAPQITAVNAGDTVVWSNKDIMNHTTKSDGTLLWDSGNIAPGKTYSRVFNAPGSYPYSCGIHPSMHGTVIVR